MGNPMIEKKAIENWEKILKFNSDMIASEDKSVKERIRIPLTPITIEAKTLFQFFKLLYPYFINERAGVVDLVISDNEDTILNAGFYHTSIPGIHESKKHLDTEIINMEKYLLEEKGDLFTELQEKISDQKDELISHVRIIKKEGIDRINKYLELIQDSSLQDFVMQFLDLVQSLLKDRVFSIYPKPNVLKFMEQLVELLDPFRLSEIFTSIWELIPEINAVIVFYSKKTSFILHIKKETKEKDKDNSGLNFSLWNPHELGLNFQGLENNEIIELVHDELNKKPIYLFHIDDVLSIVKELFELKKPIKFSKVKLLLKKLLFGFRNFEIRWFKYPRPLIYNALIRFLMKMIKININLKNISHWEIPEVIFNSFSRNFGLNSKISIIFTDLNRYKGKKSKKVQDQIKGSFHTALLLDIQQEALKDIRKIPKEDIFGKNKEEFSLPDIRMKLSDKFGYTSAVIVVDKFLIESLLKRLIFHPSKLNFFGRMSLMKLCKNEKYFKIYPELPMFKFFNNTGSYRFLKLLIPILIDWYEF